MSDLTWPPLNEQTNQMNDIQIRPLSVSKWSLFKDFRLAALKSTPGMFATSFDEASARCPAAWKASIAGPNHQVFGLFDGTRLIGITGVLGGREKLKLQDRVSDHVLYRARIQTTWPFIQALCRSP
jgi:hypothetical protein